MGFIFRRQSTFCSTCKIRLLKTETKLSPGDVVIQRNTMDAWRNDTKAPVYWVAVLVPIRRQA